MKTSFWVLNTSIFVFLLFYGFIINFLRIKVDAKRRPFAHPQELIMYSGLYDKKSEMNVAKKILRLYVFYVEFVLRPKKENYVYCVLFNLPHHTIILLLARIIPFVSWNHLIDHIFCSELQHPSSEDSSVLHIIRSYIKTIECSLSFQVSKWFSNKLSQSLIKHNFERQMWLCIQISNEQVYVQNKARSVCNVFNKMFLLNIHLGLYVKAMVHVPKKDSATWR